MIRLIQFPLVALALLIFSSCAHKGAVETKSATQPGLDPELTNFGYPREVKFYEFVDQKQNLKMAYVIGEPEKANGKTVLLLHGKNFSAAYWEPTIQLLTKQGFRVIAPDQIGFGKSSKPAAYQFSFQSLAKNTRKLLETLGIQDTIIVGHSMGGMLAARYTLMYPTATTRLVLVNPIGLEDWKTMVPYRSIDENFASELKSTPESIREYQRTSYFGGEWKPEYESLVEVLGGWTKHPEYPRVAWVSALTSDMIFTQPVIYEFPLIKAKTLLIIGQRDRTAIGRAWAPAPFKETMGNYPALGKRAAKAIRGAKLVELSGVGHIPQVEAFEDYSKALLEFIR